MRQICAWCGKETVNSVDPDLQTPLSTHGICAECSNSFRFQGGVKLREYIESIPVPVLVVNADASVYGANTPARAIFRKELPEVTEQFLGNVFECRYARLPGGCGKTVHCSGCTIRRAVTETSSTGKSLQHIPSTLLQDLPAGMNEMRFLISTEMVGEVVLLQIGEINEPCVAHR